MVDSLSCFSCRALADTRNSSMSPPLGIDPTYKQRPWYVLSCLWDGAYKRNLTSKSNEKELHMLLSK